MSVILNFNEKEKEEFKKHCKKHKRIDDGCGCEGECFLIGNDVYKLYNDDYKVNNPICKDDLPLESFLFPTEIYTYNNKVFAYKTPYIQKNQLRLNSFSTGNTPDIKKIKNALSILIKDIYVLSQNNIEAIDFTYRNTIFDGERFYIIDTLDYEKVDENTYQNNISALKEIIDCFMLNCILACDIYNNPYNDKEIEEIHGLLDYIDKIATKTEEEHENKKIKRP